MNKSALKNFQLISLFLHLQFWGCSFIGTKSYPEPILLNSRSAMTLRYTYSEVEVLAPLTWSEDGSVGAEVTLLQRNNPSAPLFNTTVFQGDSFRVILPVNIFSANSLGNLIEIQPMGGRYAPIRHFFSTPQDSLLELPVFSLP